jgi:hypothetical protein
MRCCVTIEEPPASLHFPLCTPSAHSPPRHGIGIFVPTTSPARIPSGLRASSSQWSLVWIAVLRNWPACDLNGGLRHDNSGDWCCRALILRRRRRNSGHSTSVQCAQHTISLMSSDGYAETTFNCCKHAAASAGPIEDSE